MKSQFAQSTSVPVENSRNEIEKTLKKYGADCFGYTSEPDKAMIGFRLSDRFYRLSIDVPTSPQKERQRWRVLLLLIKAKLEAVATGMSSVDEQFMHVIVMPNGKTIGEAIKPQIDQAYKDGLQPPLLLLGGSK